VLLALLPLLPGCATLTHDVARRAGGGLAWRLEASPTLPLAALGLEERSVQAALDRLVDLSEGEGWTLRAWTLDAGPHGTLVVHAHLDGGAAWRALADALERAFPDAPAALHPPGLDPEGDALVLRLPAEPGRPTGPGTWQLRTRARSGEPLRRRVLAAMPTVLDEGLARRVPLAPDARGWVEALRGGGPSLLAALAGLGMLLWSVRRTRRRAGLPAPGFRRGARPAGDDAADGGC
jgi:hypothetical protein